MGDIARTKFKLSESYSYSLTWLVPHPTWNLKFGGTYSQTNSNKVIRERVEKKQNDPHTRQRKYKKFAEIDQKSDGQLGG